RLVSRLHGSVRRQRQLRIPVLLLEVAHGLGHARAAEEEQLVDALDLTHALVEAAARDDELPDPVHARIEAVEMHADARTRARGIDGAAHPGIRRRENESRK